MIINNENTENPIFERIKLVIEKYCTSDAEFARMIDVPRSSLSTMFNKSKTVSFPILDKILSVFTDVSADWLLRGIGDMELSTSTKITDANEYLVKRFEEVINELRDIKDELKEKEELINKQKDEIEMLKGKPIYKIEKKDDDVSCVAERTSELEKNNNN